MIRYERELRSMPAWLLREYLRELGGEPEPGGGVQGPGWHADVILMQDFTLGSLRIGQVHLVVQASEAAWLTLGPALEKKLLRAGG